MLLFTGLVKEIAKVIHFDGKILRLQAKYRPNIGDSIAVNGACLSVTNIFEKGFEVELGDETRKVVALENYKGRVHIEPAMKPSDRFEGHIVQGHIDCVGVIEGIKRGENATDFFIRIPREYMRFVVPKGSIAVDGVSLTINEVLGDRFRLTIIPITLEHTLFGSYTPYRRVNIETDMFARYLYHMMKNENTVGWEEIERIQALF